MAKLSKLRVMISSRCDDKFPAGPAGQPLSEIRRELKTEIEELEIFGKDVFEVWINEETPPQGGTWDSWDVCLQAVKDCDILVALSNGHGTDALPGRIPGRASLCEVLVAIVLRAIGVGAQTTPGRPNVLPARRSECFGFISAKIRRNFAEIS